MHVSSLIRRTSRKGPGSWTEPILMDSLRRTARENNIDSARSGASAVPKGGRRKQPEATPVAGASFIDGADNAYQYAATGAGVGGHGGPSHPSRYSWKADPAWNQAPPFIDPPKGGLQGNSHGTTQQNATRVGTAGQPLGEGSSGASPGFETGSSSGPQKNWLGGKQGGAVPDSIDSATAPNSFGSGEFSMVNRQKLTMTHFLRSLAEATVQPRDADSRIFGGDGATKLAEQRQDLKTMDQRLAPYQHDDLLNDFLKNIDRLHTPSGALCQREVLKGRFVGLLFFTESERSLSFMRMLQPFQAAHSPDLVIVAVSLAGKEMMDVTRGFGFFHCTHRDGATWVTRDAGLMIRPLVPLPRLIIVDGTSGFEVTRRGLTAVVARPETCFEAWRRGECGFEYGDFLQTLYL